MNETPELLFATSVHSRDKPPGRTGGCVGTFLHLFDWNPRKRLFSTKRLPAERPGKATKKKFKDERMPVAKLLLLADEENRGGFPSPKKLSAAAAAAINPGGDRSKDNGDEHTGKRVPGVVARLMGLESLPECNEGKDSPQQSKPAAVEVRPLQELLHARQEPVLLQDLLREREYLEAKKLSLKERLAVPVPGFVQKLPSDPGPYGSYVPPRDGFRKSMRAGEHTQPYSEYKYHKSLRPLKKSGRDLSDAKHLILALSPRSNAEGLRPILLPSKMHNKLLSSPIKSPTKMGSRSARLLEAAVKILEPSLQSSTARSRPPVRPSTTYTGKDYKDLQSEVVKAEERKERLPTVEKKVALATNAGRALKAQSMSRSWNGREETGRYGNEAKNGSSLQDGPGRRRSSDHQSHSNPHSRTASPMRSTVSSTQRSRGNSNKYSAPPEENVRLVEEVKTVVPQGFEEAYEGGLRPLNVGRREHIRLDKYEVDDRRVSEKYIVSSLSVGNSPYSEINERGAPSSFHDPLRRSGSTKEGPTPPTPTAAARTRFLRSKSVKEEKITKSSGGQFPHHYKQHKESRIKQEPSYHSGGQNVAINVESRSKADSPSPNEAVIDVSENVVSKTIETVQSRPLTSPIQVSDDVPRAPEAQSSQSPVVVDDPVNPVPESVSEPQAQVLDATEPLEKDLKDTLAGVRVSSSGGLLSYSRLFGARKNGTRERKGDYTKEKAKEKTKSRTEGTQKKSETSLVRSLLRRRITPPSSASTSPVNEKKKRGGFRLSLSAQPSPEPSECDTLGYLSDDCSLGMEAESNCARSEGKSKDHGVYPEAFDLKISSVKCVDDIFPDKPPVDKGCLKLLEDETKRGLIEGFDFVADLNELDNIRGGILGKYAAHLMDDNEFEKMFSSGIVNSGSGRGGFSYSPLVEMEEQRTTFVDTYLLDEGAEVEKCVSFLGRTSVASSPEDEGLIKREVSAAEELTSMPDVVPTDEFIGAVSEDLNGPSTPELSESRKLEDREHIIERVSKKFGSKGRVVLTDEDDGAEEAVCTLVGREDCGQPSPVSVLECSFEEETESSQGNVQEGICELDDEDLDEDQEAYMDDLLYESVAALQKVRKPRKSRKSTPVVTAVTDIEVSPDSGRTDNEKIVGALLDISRIRRIDPSDIGLEVDGVEPFQEEEEDYVSKVLALWEKFPNFSDRFSSDLPVNPTLFDRLESQERAIAWGREKDEKELSTQQEGPNRSFKQWQSLWLHRRLLFDSVNEALSYRLKYRFPDPWIAKPVLRPQPQGKHLVEEVYREITEWREGTTEELDTIIEKDMSRGCGNWSNLNQEVAEIGLEIERNILKVMIEELVADMMGISITESRMGSVAAH
ncbi:hypothetical protein R1flu_002008 [Riccia fluitans]|uniref:DUF4378 domain-containing protein n=1 Tax=Riccia fluitans TaxID=41844 RepID=A0ABD1Y4W2_9MARC